MSNAEADSALDGQEPVADTPPADSASSGQEQGDQSRINGLMSLAQRRTAERDAALAEIEQLKAQMAEQAVPEDQPHQPSQVELMYPERFAQAEPEVDEVDPMAPPEPPTIVMGVSPARSQSVPIGDPPVIGNTSSPAARYLQDQAEIASMKTQLNRLGAQWVAEDAKQRGLMD